MQNFQCKSCLNCRAVNAIDAKFCAKCGQPLSSKSLSQVPGFWENTRNAIIITALATSTVFFAAISCLLGNRSQPTTSVTEPQFRKVESPTPEALNRDAEMDAALSDGNASVSNKIAKKPKASPSPTPDEYVADNEDYSQTEPTPTKLPPYTPPAPTAQTVTGGFIDGPRGGCYYINASGKKTYVDHSLCGRPDQPARVPAPSSLYSQPAATSSSSGGYYTGPRGGCYTYSASGKKRYVDRSLCN